MDTRKDGVTALKKHNVGIISLTAIMYCACAAGAFGVEEMVSASGPGMTIPVSYTHLSLQIQEKCTG